MDCNSSHSSSQAKAGLGVVNFINNYQDQIEMDRLVVDVAILYTISGTH
jgi:hypothetical protein